MKSIFQTLFLSLHEDYQIFRKYISRYLSEPNNEESVMYLSNIEALAVKYKNYSQELSVYGEQSSRFLQFCEALAKLKGQNELALGKIYRNTHKLISDLTQAQADRAKKLQEDFDKMEKNFSYLLNPSYLPAAYQASLVEISRRNEFSKVFEREVACLQGLVDKENERRQLFITQQGKILPCEFVPGLKHMAPAIKVLNRKEEDLPAITGLHKEQLVVCHNSSDELQKELEVEKQKSHLLRARVAELEKQKSQFQENFNQDKKIQSLYKEIEELNVCIQNTHNYYQKDLGDNLLSSPLAEISENGSQKVVEKLSRRIQNLTELLQQTTKASFNLFVKKSNDKLRNLHEMKKMCEQLELDKKRINDKVSELENRYNQSVVQCKKLQSQRDNMKLQLESMAQELDQSKKDIKSKEELIVSKDDIIRSINEIKNQQNFDIQQYKEQIKQYDRKIKVEHADMLTQIHSVNVQEQEKLKKQIKVLENELSNKSMEIEKLNQRLAELKKELSCKSQQLELQIVETSTALKASEKLKSQAQEVQTRSQNQEQVLEKRQAEIAALQKQCNQLQSDKNLLTEELQKFKNLQQETQKKLSKVSEGLKLIENERNNLFSQIEKQNFELEKKNIEIANMSKELKIFADEHKNKLEQLEQLNEDNQTDKQKIQKLQEELNDKRIELNLKMTKHELLEADLDNKNKEIQYLKQ